MKASVARWPQHASMKKVCQRFVSREERKTVQDSQVGAGWPRATDHLRDVAKSFVDLQEKRHLADYDLATPMTHQDAVNAVKAASDAQVSLKFALDNGDPWAPCFLLLLVSGDAKDRK